MVFLTAVLALTLTGCSYAENRMRMKSGIDDDAQYQLYQQYTAEGKVANGFYTEDGVVLQTAEENPTGKQVHVTFARNNHLNIRYYTDAEKTREINPDACYLNPGSCIYAAVATSSAAHSASYEFSEFRVFEYIDGEKREELKGLGGGDLVCQIPTDFAGTDLSILPVGVYQDRVLSFSDYYTDDQGARHELTGKWLVDDKECSDSISVSPVNTCSIRYEFDKEYYFFVSSDPVCYYSSDESGFVTFNPSDPEDTINNYSVELHPYLSTEITIGASRSPSRF